MLQKQLGLPDFGPLSQDKGCIELTKGRKALAAVKAGQFDKAVALCAREWASLPGAGYGQHEQSLEKLRAIYQKGRRQSGRGRMTMEAQPSQDGRTRLLLGPVERWLVGAVAGGIVLGVVWLVGSLH